MLEKNLLKIRLKTFVTKIFSANYKIPDIQRRETLITSHGYSFS